MTSCVFERRTDGRYFCPTCDPGQKRTQKRPSVRKCIGGPILHAAPATAGPGTHLSRLIARFQRVLPWWDMQPHSGCGCNDTARWMDQLGPDGCEERITAIVKRLKNEARKRKITFPFQGWAAEKMVRWAIKRARKQQAVNND